jgi:L-fucose isomerase-like protein
MTIMEQSGKPTIAIDDLYAGSGEILGPGPEIRKKNLRAALVSSSDFDDVVRAVRWLEVIAAMKGAKIINVRDRNISGQVKTLKDVLGTEMVQMKSDELRRRYGEACEKKSKVWAKYWTKGAKDVVGVDPEDIFKAGKIHVAFLKALEDKEADALTMDCLGLFYGNKIDAYPCLSWFELLNQGLTGICESDVDSTATALLMRYLCNRPGYVSDPVIDTSTGEIIYAHCVASNRVYGPNGKANKYVLRTHAEDRKGVSLQSLMPIGKPVTTLRVALGDRHMMIHTGVTSRNVTELDKACRTKLAAESDAELLLRNWTRGWHRVTVYGDYRKDFVNLAQLLGLTVIEEDKPMA